MRIGRQAAAFLIGAALIGGMGTGAARAATVVQKPAAPASTAAAVPDPDSACRTYGPGFRKLPGSDTCVKLGGIVQGDYYGASAGGGGGMSPTEPALRTTR